VMTVVVDAAVVLVAAPLVVMVVVLVSEVTWLMLFRLVLVMTVVVDAAVVLVAAQLVVMVVVLVSEVKWLMLFLLVSVMTVVVDSAVVLVAAPLVVMVHVVGALLVVLVQYHAMLSVVSVAVGLAPYIMDVPCEYFADVWYYHTCRSSLFSSFFLVLLYMLPCCFDEFYIQTNTWSITVVYALL
jgi:hypothetical protein